MTENHPITPPPELVQQWITEGRYQDYCSTTEYAITQAARWGADQELEACCALMDDWGLEESDLRAARRPNPVLALPEDATVIKPSERTILVPIPEPVPVAERPWEREGWCNGQDRCWWGRQETYDWYTDWTLATYQEIQDSCDYSFMTDCLPAHALPVPQVNTGIKRHRAGGFQ